MLGRLKVLSARKRWFLLIGVIVLALISWLLASGHWVNPFNKNLEVHISVPLATITKDRFIVVDGELRNHTVHAHGAPWGSCAQQITYFMDNKEFYSNANGAVCAIGYPNINPGEVMKQTFTIDPSNFSVGEHSFYIVYEDIKSNVLNINLANPISLANCYNFTQYASPLCSQIRIVSDVSDSSDKTRCESYLDYLKKNTSVKPIPSLSSVDCVEKDSAVPYLVANVPKNDPDKWVDKLSNHFSYTNFPNDYAGVTLVTYPEPN